MLPHPDSQLHLQDACLIHGPLQIDTLAIQNGSGLVVLYIFHCQSSRLQSYCLNSQKSSFLSQPVKRQTMTLLSKHEKRDSRRLPNAANLSESLYFWAFIELFTCFVTEDRPSPHVSSSGTNPPAGPPRLYTRARSATWHPLPLLRRCS